MVREKTKEEQEREFKNKSESYERKLKNKNNKFIIVFISFIIIGYVFFLFSPKIFHEKPERFYTDIGTEVVFTGGTITPSSWVFAENRSMMQVEFTHKSNQTIPPDIEVNAATSYDDRTKPSSRLKAEVIYKENDYYIANIYDIPKDYYCVSLRIKTVENKNSESTNNEEVAADGLGNQVVRELSETQNPTEKTAEKTSTAVIYTCSDSVKTVPSIYPLDDYIYRIKRIQSKIRADYIEVNKNITNINTLKGDNKDLELKNEEIKKQMLYMTSLEKQTKEKEIESNTNKINDNISAITGLESANSSLQREIKEYTEIIKRIAAENENREYKAPDQSLSQQPTEVFSHSNTPKSSSETTSSLPNHKPTQVPTQAPTQKPTQKSVQKPTQSPTQKPNK